MLSRSMTLAEKNPLFTYLG